MTPRRTTALLLPALALSLAPVQAEAAGYHWTTVVNVSNAKLQFCKVPTTATGPWKVRVRVNARQATERVKGSARATKNGTGIGTGWSSAWIYPGKVSGIGVVKLPRGSAYSMSGLLRAPVAGGGGALKARSIPHC